MKKSLKELSEKMRKLDICQMTTETSRGYLTSRPMSNNGDVAYDGNSWFFSYEESQKVKDIERNKMVNLSFEGKDDLYISVAGQARIIRSKKMMQEHWLPELEQWFKEGIDTPGIVMIHVKGRRIKYWQGEEEGEIELK